MADQPWLAEAVIACRISSDPLGRRTSALAGGIAVAREDAEFLLEMLPAFAVVPRSPCSRPARGSAAAACANLTATWRQATFPI
ncbi:hypothetical protein FSB64_25045 [Paraburkholderia sp. JPY454]|uniref:Uncharacterized protein n=1 Tax=Paraburkholderia youngii TaxID=2782701 RepID=A0ABX2NR94_9BURK|nr:hypothetical protein [Paraburkholderia youngii]